MRLIDGCTTGRVPVIEIETENDVMARIASAFAGGIGTRGPSVVPSLAL